MDTSGAWPLQGSADTSKGSKGAYPLGIFFMSEQFTTFIVPSGDRSAEEAMNRFIRGHRVLRVIPQFEAGCWQFCVAWESGTEETDRSASRGSARVDYKDVLDAPTFALFAQLREVRKTLLK